MTATAGPAGRLLLLDSASLYFRAFFGVPDSVRAPDGTPVNAVRGLVEMIARLVADRRPTRLVACWDDDWRPAFRVEAVPSYKAHRVAREVPGTTGEEEVPEALTAQVPVIVEVLAALGIPRLGAPGHEADDVIGTLVAREAARPAAERAAVDVVTGDRDLFQLVDDAVPVRVLYPVKGVKDLLEVDQGVLVERYGVPTGRAYADMAVLRGDPSDGLPGVPGIGEKTAASLLARYGTLEGVLAARDAADRGLTATQRTRLTDAADYLAVAPRVVTVAPDAPVADVDDRLPAVPADPDALVTLAERWGLSSSLRRIVDVLADAAGARG
ncbi:5'-3' exonuclease, N-terminal resolvase-like domain protein [Cellulomonas flavigena DSM 20109]|uniref:5'-3' exonuclease n=1 Tax=Cellulomonas flavigena (strain ATCC 482 / DSM 20109 / BCRC 11376 / JCM 18109 / NBRC 3775 / NCIMB 8073 / NRS 134) TaxID=446466 RepID=D5UIK3_CELFN|nr:5'-3' exonuclease [Cellulomonas flavigena]ADG73502.1 5'-3' exonuclease, N-terminal resolvase-like domain protein [Cellulomonas flavigena DSM 20109]